jgi:hypothetical protein
MGVAVISPGEAECANEGRGENRQPELAVKRGHVCSRYCMEDWLIVRTAAAESVSQHGTWFFFRFDDVRQPTPTQPFALN